MKIKVWFLLVFITINSTLYSKNQTINSNNNLISFFNSLTDTINFYSRNPEMQFNPSIFIKLDSINECNYKIDNNSYEVSLKNTQENYEPIFLIVDSLAKTSIYSNKIIANEIYHQILSFLYNKSYLTSQEFRFAKKAIISDIDNCMKFTSTNNIMYMKEDMITDELIAKIKEFLTNNKRTKKEAAVYLNSIDKFYNINDTIGLSNETIELRKGNKQNIDHLEKINYWIKESKKQNQELNVYLDSMQQIVNINILDKFYNMQISITPLIEFVGNFYIKDLSTEIENIYRSDSVYFNAGLVLARFQYKNYENEIIKNILTRYDLLLKTDGDLLDFRTLFDQLCYINTNNSLSAISSFVSLNNKEYDDIFNMYYTYGEYFLSLINYKILNLPWEYSYENLIQINKSKNDYNKLVIDHIWLATHKLSEEDLIKITNWLKNNKNEFVIEKKLNCNYL